MNKYYILEGEINEVAVRDTLDWIENLSELKLNNPVTVLPILYLNSPGGRGDLSEILTRELSKVEDLTIVACGELSSAAFNMFLKIKAKKIITKWFRYGMFHKPDTSVSLSNLKNVRIETPSRIVTKDYKRISKIDEDILPLLNLDRKERKLYKEGDEVYFDRKRMKKILKNLEKRYAKK